MLDQEQRSRTEPGRTSVTATIVGLALAGIVTADVLLPGQHTTMPLLMTVPTLTTCLRGRARCAAASGLMTLAAAVPLGLFHWQARPVTVITSLLGIALTATLMWLVGRRSERSHHAQADLRRIAEVMQRAVLRPVQQHVGTVAVEVRYLAAAAGARAGGDLYDVIRTPHGVRLIVGDVMGKGLPAVEKAADVLGAFRELAHHERTLTGMALRLDAFLAAGCREEEFVTALLAEIPDGETSAAVVSCGHPPPLVLSRHGALFADALPPAPPLGLFQLAEGQCTVRTITLNPDDLLIIYTDGVSEARDAHGRFYPLAKRAAVLSHGDPGQLADQLEADLRAHAGGRLQDDAALLVLRADQTTPAGRYEMARHQEGPGRQ